MTNKVTEKQGQHQAKEVKQQNHSPKNKKGSVPLHKEALLIKSGKDKTFADIVKLIRSLELQKANVEVCPIRMTRAEDVLVRFDISDKIWEDFAVAVKASIGVNGTIRTSLPRRSMEIMDLDEAVTEEDILKSLTRALEGPYTLILAGRT